MKMKHRVILGTVLLTILVLGNCAQQQNVQVVEIEYFDQKPPGMEAMLFAPGIISTNLHDDGAPIFTPDGKEIYFRIAAEPQSFIAFMRHENGSWSDPEMAPFVGQYSIGRMGISPDGQRLYFSSNRPLLGDGEPKGDFDLWYVERERNSWGEPQNLGAPINSECDELDVSATADGTLYFHREGSCGDTVPFDVLRSRLVDDQHTEPNNLGDPINTSSIEVAPFIAPDESFVIFCSFGRSGQGGGDLYVSFRNPNGSWTEPENLGAGVNSRYDEKFASLSPDGKYLFFVSTRPTEADLGWSYSGTPGYAELVSVPESSPAYFGDVYWVDARIIEELRPEHLR